MKIAVIASQVGVGRKFVEENLIEVLEGSTSIECMDYINNETSIEESEYCILVSDSRKVNLEALKLLIKSVEAKGRAYGVVFNKTDDNNNENKKYCMNKQIKVLGEIPFDDIISINSDEGKIISIENEEYRMKFLNLINNVFVHMANMIFKLKADFDSK